MDNILRKGGFFQNKNDHKVVDNRETRVADEEHLNMLSIIKSELVLVKSYFMNRIIGSSMAPLTCICVIV